MVQRLELELRGPCSEYPRNLPEVNDTVAVIRANGRVSLLTVTTVEPSINGTVIWAGRGERLFAHDCYLVYSVDR